jgi:DeoR family transcriptional regulator, aga operon transcriptional repressor
MATEEKGSKQERRYAAILEQLHKTGSANVEELCKQLHVSVHTVRRDLEALHERGSLRRVHGGATPLEPFFYEPFRSDHSFQEQIESYTEEKRRIARVAASLVNEGDVVALTPGTTTTEIVRCLPMNRNLTVVTNTVNIAMELSKRKDIQVFVTGGALRGTWFSLVGPTATQYMSKVIIDTLFIGVNGIDATRGMTCYNTDEAELNRVMVQQARRRIVVADSSKFGVVASWLIAPTSVIDVIVTDIGVSEESIRPFREQGTAIHLV